MAAEEKPSDYFYPLQTEGGDLPLILSFLL